jgi:hypothetical protein
MILETKIHNFYFITYNCLINDVDLFNKHNVSILFIISYKINKKYIRFAM